MLPNNPPAARLSDSERRDLLTDTLKRNIGWIEFADGKAGAVLVFMVAIVGIVLSPATAAATNMSDRLRTNPDCGDWLAAYLFALVCIGAILSISYSGYQVFRTLAPRLDRAPDQSGLIFFADIAKNDLDEWSGKFGAATSGSVNDDLVEQVHTTSIVARDKHRDAAASIKCLVRFVLPASALLYVVAESITG